MDCEYSPGSHQIYTWMVKLRSTITAVKIWHFINTSICRWWLKYSFQNNDGVDINPVNKRKESVKKAYYYLLRCKYNGGDHAYIKWETRTLI